MRRCLLALCLALVGACRGESGPASGRYIETAEGYTMVLREGDDVLEQLRRLAAEQDLPSATFSGFGFVHATFGYFDAQKKEYEPKEFRDVELAGATGSVAWQDGEPSVHAHGVVTDRTFSTYGGHLLALVVGRGSVEITVVKHKARLRREKDPVLGANVLSLSDN